MHNRATSPTIPSVSTAKQRKRLILGFLFLTAIFIAAFTTPLKDSNKTFTVVLDAGHGGKDPGNLGTGRHKKTEKDVSLDVVLQLGKLIENEFPEVEVIYTRKTDVFPTLNDRVQIANKAKADLFISVHCNANNNKEAYGSETFVMGLHKSEESLQNAMRENASIYLEDDYEKTYAGFDPKNPDTYIALSLRENVFLDHSLLLAKNVQDQFRVKVGRKDRGVKQAGYYVISFTNMPSILVELGFLTNSNEEDYLHSSDGKANMSNALFKAFKDFKAKKLKASAEQPVAISPNSNPKAETETSGAASKPSGPIVYKEIKQGIKFQVQILTSSKALPKNSAQFKGIEQVDEYFSGNVYKYMAGSTSNFNEAKELQKQLRALGFKDAFIVGFENGQRIDLNEAIRKATN